MLGSQLVKDVDANNKLETIKNDTNSIKSEMQSLLRSISEIGNDTKDINDTLNIKDSGIVGVQEFKLNATDELFFNLIADPTGRRVEELYNSTGVKDRRLLEEASRQKNQHYKIANKMRKFSSDLSSEDARVRLLMIISNDRLKIAKLYLEIKALHKSSVSRFLEKASSTPTLKDSIDLNNFLLAQLLSETQYSNMLKAYDAMNYVMRETPLKSLR